jgi:hypothetical protein
MDATDPNLTPFERHGGKLIMTAGWSDPGGPLSGIELRELDSAAASSGKVADRRITLRLNQRPRETLGFKTPAAKLHASVASIH